MNRQTGTPRLLREINDRAALDLLLAHGSMTRPQLVAATGFSKPTASEVLNRLVISGLVSQTGTVSGGRGPSAQVYRINPDAGFVIGIDVTPINVVVAVVDLTGRTLASASGSLDTQERGLPTRTVAAVVRRAAGRANVTVAEAGQIVVASPGVHHPETDQVRHAEHMPAWSRPGIAAELRRRLGAPVVLENDVNVAAVVERVRGAATEVASFALLWVGPGLGLAIDLGGTLHRGNTGGAGEVGYMPLPGFGEHPESSSTEFQTLVSEVAVVDLGHQHGLTGADAAEVLTAALERPTRGKAFLDELAARLATGTAMIVSVLDPAMVVLAGPTSRAGGEPLRSLIEARLHELTPLRPALRLSDVPGNPVLAGAVEVGLQSLRTSLFSATS